MSGTSRKAPDLVHGKKFEQDIDDIFKPLQNKYPASWDRVIDTHTAGNLVRTAEGDFSLTLPAGRGRTFAFCIECKASVIHNCLSENFRSTIKVGQRARMMIKERAGVIGIYFFFSVKEQIIQIWKATPLLMQWPDKRQPLIGQPVLELSPANMRVFAENWVCDPLTISARYFGLPLSP